MKTEEKTFTKEEVNRIVEERLSRERKNGEALSDVKAMLFALKDAGAIEGGSIAELAEDLYAKLGAGASEKAEATAAEAVGNAEDEAAGSADAREVKIKGEAEALAAKYPDLDVASLLSDPDFGALYSAMTAENASLTLTDVYEAFVRAKQIEERNREARAMKRTPSVHNAKSAAELSLTPSQRQIAANAGMSYAEYAKLLSEIPERKMR